MRQFEEVQKNKIFYHNQVNRSMIKQHNDVKESKFYFVVIIKSKTL